MTIDIETEKLLTFTEAATLLPDRPHVATLYRWWRHGRYGVKLESLLFGRRRYTSREALQRFAERVTAIANGEPPPVRTVAQRRREHERAVRELEAMGI
jgi:hypothetical protein